MEINLEKIHKNLDYIRESLGEIENISRLKDREVLENRTALGALKFELITAVEAICNILTHLLLKLKNKTCSGYIDCIKKAGEVSLIPEELALKLVGLAKLRNLLVHRYWEVDDKLLLEEVKANKGDLEAFVVEMEKLMQNLCKGGKR
jgi:uncharacterized protein YutE (UPF0331/DUF86 family)